MTPSPAQTPIKRSTVNTPASGRGDSPARHASDILQSTINGVKKEADRDTPMADAPPAPTGGFTAINSGGFTAVNSGFTSVNRGTNGDSKSFTPDSKRFDSPTPSAKNTPDNRASSLVATALKRQMSCDSSSDSAKKEVDEREDIDGGSRRSKRLKKGTHRCMVLCWTFYSSSAPVPQRRPPVPVGLRRAFPFQCCSWYRAGISIAMTHTASDWPHSSPLTIVLRCRPHCGWITHDAIPSFSTKDSTRRSCASRRGENIPHYIA